MTLKVQGDRTPWLELLRMDTQADSFGPNQINCIKKYVHNTGMRVRIIEVFEQMYNHLMTDDTNDAEELNTRFDNALGEYNFHIAQRIQSLKNPVITGKKDFRETRFFLQDLLKEIDLVVKYSVEEGCAVAKDDIRDLIKVIPSYLDKLEIKAKKELKQIIQNLQKLGKSIKEKDFEQANTVLFEIKKDLNLLVKDIAN